jgi:hypothetical protein
MTKEAIPESWYWRGVKRHLVNEFRDGNEDIVVYKEWNSRKQCWNYHAEQRHTVAYEVMLAKRVEDEAK